MSRQNKCSQRRPKAGLFTIAAVLLQTLPLHRVYFWTKVLSLYRSHPWVGNCEIILLHKLKYALQGPLTQVTAGSTDNDAIVCWNDLNVKRQP